MTGKPLPFTLDDILNRIDRNHRKPGAYPLPDHVKSEVFEALEESQPKGLEETLDVICDVIMVYESKFETNPYKLTTQPDDGPA